MSSRRKVGAYEILGKLGSGAMGEVYKAVDTHMFQRVVALKILSERLSGNDAARRRFSREVEVAAKLVHPNIVTIHDQGEYDDRPYFVMEFIDGTNLAGIIEQPCGEDLGRRLEMATQICEALEYAHRHGVVHRDVKPSNIMVADRAGRDHVTLVDFGIVHLEHSHGTTEDSQPGTFGFMSPEQICGDEVDPRSDLFSLGIVLYQMFTGSHPFRARSDLLIPQNILSTDPEPAGAVNPAVGSELDAVVLRLLNKDRKRRIQTAREVAEALREIAYPGVRRSEAGEPRPELSTPPPAKTRQDADDLAKVQMALEQGEYTVARGAAVDHLKNQSDSKEARKLLDRVLAIIEGRIPYLEYRELLIEGEQQMQRGNLREAKAAIDAAVSIWPEDYEARNLETDARAVFEERIRIVLKEASECVDTAEQRQRQSTANMPLLKEAAENNEHAARLLTEARELEPDHPQATALQARIAGLRGRISTRVESAESRVAESLAQARDLMDDAESQAADSLEGLDDALEACDSAKERLSAVVTVDPENQEYARLSRALRELEASLRTHRTRQSRKRREQCEAALEAVRASAQARRHREVVDTLQDLMRTSRKADWPRDLATEAKQLLGASRKALRRRRNALVFGGVGVLVLLVAGVVGTSAALDWWQARRYDQSIAGCDRLFGEVEVLFRSDDQAAMEDARRSLSEARVFLKIAENIRPQDPQVASANSRLQELTEDLERRIESQAERKAAHSLQVKLDRDIDDARRRLGEIGSPAGRGIEDLETEISRLVILVAEANDLAANAPGDDEATALTQSTRERLEAFKQERDRVVQDLARRGAVDQLLDLARSRWRDARSLPESTELQLRMKLLALGQARDAARQLLSQAPETVDAVRLSSGIRDDLEGVGEGLQARQITDLEKDLDSVKREPMGDLQQVQRKQLAVADVTARLEVLLTTTSRQDAVRRLLKDARAERLEVLVALHGHYLSRAVRERLNVAARALDEAHLLPEADEDGMRAKLARFDFVQQQLAVVQSNDPSNEVASELGVKVTKERDRLRDRLDESLERAQREREVLEVLQVWETGYEGRDPAAVAAAVAFPGSDRATLERQFKDLKQVKIEIEQVRVVFDEPATATARTARVECRGYLETILDFGPAGPKRRQFDAVELKMIDDVWKIVGIRWVR